MRKFFFILALLAINAFVSGQSNFVRAVIINNVGDSIYGDINYRNWKNNPQSINFINAVGEKLNLDPSSIKGFHVPSVNETYASYTVEMDMLPDDQNVAISNNFIETPILKKRVFLLQLVMHPALRLYQYTDSYREHFYYKRGNEEPVELIHHYLYNESTKKVDENVNYKDQLSSLFAACPHLAGISKTKFRKREMQDIFLKYLQCIAPGSAVDIKKKDKESFKFGIVAGLMLNKFKFKGTNISLVDDNYTDNLSPVLGISLDVGLSRNRNKWHIVNEIIYKSYKTSSSFTRPYGNGYMVTSDVDLNFSYAQINTILRYVFPSTAFLKPFINLGIGNALMISENKNNIHNVYSFGREEDVKAFDGPNKYELSILGSAGLMVGSIQLELRFAGSKRGFSPTEDLFVNTKSFQFIFSYQF